MLGKIEQPSLRSKISWSRSTGWTGSGVQKFSLVRNGDEYGRPVSARFDREEPVVGSAGWNGRALPRGKRDQRRPRGGHLLVERPVLGKRRCRVRLVQRLGRRDNLHLALLPRRCILLLLLVRLAHVPWIRELHGDIGPVRVRRSERLHQSTELQRIR